MKVTNTNKVQNSQVRQTLPLKKVNSLISKKNALCSFFMLLSTFSAFASAALKSSIGGWESDIQTVLNAAVAVFAIVGAFLIFIQYMQGNEQAQKNLIRYVIGLAIFGLSALIVDVFVAP